VRWQALQLAAAQTGTAEDDLEIRGTPVRILVSPGELAGQPVLPLVAIEPPAPAPAAPPAPTASGSADAQRIESEEEPDAFIEKPFTARHLDGVIDEILQRRRAD
jgi:hypothetical protein